MPTLQKVEVPIWAQEHIIKKHYPIRKHGKQSMFFRKSMSPQKLFYKVTNVLRSGIKESEKQGPRYIYYYKFRFNVGVFPNRHGGFSVTKTVKIVCNYTKCAKCGRHCPSEVVTVFPCKNHSSDYEKRLQTS